MDCVINDFKENIRRNRENIFGDIVGGTKADMEFVQNFTPPDFQANNFTLSISFNFNSLSGKKHKK